MYAAAVPADTKVAPAAEPVAPVPISGPSRARQCVDPFGKPWRKSGAEDVRDEGRLGDGAVEAVAAQTTEGILQAATLGVSNCAYNTTN